MIIPLNIVTPYPVRWTRYKDLTFEILKHVQYYVGGGLVYLDCEEIDKVLEFYQSAYNRFKRFGERLESEGKIYLQLLRFF